MKSKMTMRIVCAILMLLLVVGMVPAQVNAASYTTCILGDVNGDGKVTVTDATQIQKYAAKMITFTAKQKLAADVNLDGVVNVKDAPVIQKYCAKMIDSFDAYCDDTWVSLSTATTKKFTNVSGTVSGIAYINGSDWLVVSQSGSTVTIKTIANTGTAKRDAIVVIKDGGNVRAVLVRQLGKPSTFNLDGVNCYAYALQLHDDPTQPGGSKVIGPYIEPGKLSDSNWDYGAYNVINYRNNRKAMFEDAEEYIISTVEADLATMGWGIRRVDSADAKVAEGNWVIALALNPTEYYSDGKRTASAAGVFNSLPTNERDYHWYRRVDSKNGTPLRWEHKMGESDSETISFPFPKNPNDIPEGIIEANGHKLCTVDYYWDCYAGYAGAVNWDISSAFSYKGYCGNKRKSDKSEQAISCRTAEKMIVVYVLLGYYEVGPNVR